MSYGFMEKGWVFNKTEKSTMIKEKAIECDVVNKGQEVFQKETSPCQIILRDQVRWEGNTDWI